LTCTEYAWLRQKELRLHPNWGGVCLIHLNERDVSQRNGKVEGHTVAWHTEEEEEEEEEEDEEGEGDSWKFR
jgi:hypothetical protein